jgi:hypothetical protein
MRGWAAVEDAKNVKYPAISTKLPKVALWRWQEHPGSAMSSGCPLRASPRKSARASRQEDVFVHDSWNSLAANLRGEGGLLHERRTKLRQVTTPRPGWFARDVIDEGFDANCRRPPNGSRLTSCLRRFSRTRDWTKTPVPGPGQASAGCLFFNLAPGRARG